MEETLERIYTIPLRQTKSSPRNGRSDRAVRAIRTYLSKHMKAEEVWIDAAVNQAIWARGKYEIPSKIRVRARLFDDGVVEVSLPEEETKAGASIRETMAEAKEQKLADAHKGEIEAAEKAMAEGAATPSGVTKPSSKPASEEAEAGGDEEDEAKPAKAEPKPAATKETAEPEDAKKAAAPEKKDA